MHFKILVDNISGFVRDICNTNSNSQKQLKGEWGLCVYTEFNGKHILLDTGASPLFAKNAADMGIDLAAIDAGVLSHAHYDHANGMQEFFKKNDHAKFYLRDAARENCYHSYKVLKFFTYQKYIGIRKGTLKRNANRIEFVNGDVEIFPGVTLVGHKTPYVRQGKWQIPRRQLRPRTKSSFRHAQWTLHHEQLLPRRRRQHRQRDRSNIPW